MKILIILAHPSKDSFNHAIMKSYIKGAKQNNKIKTLYLGDLKFDPILRNAYKSHQPLEPDLQKAKKLITWSDKITIIYPTWWTSFPAILKGFFDRILLPGFAYKYTGPLRWKKLLKGKSARVITTLDSPLFYYKLIVGTPAKKQIKGTLGFCGIKPVKINYISALKFKNKKARKKILEKFYGIGLREK